MTSKEFRIFLETVRDLLVTSESKEEALKRFNELEVVKEAKKQRSSKENQDSLYYGNR
ncbi:MAG: hypothetical protein IJU50_11490 [Lachnospiraceae bacterium]|nr:hypothetical protein [Lachnospiraceae bacterium]